jgi:hypothetical protein
VLAADGIDRNFLTARKNKGQGAREQIPGYFRYHILIAPNLPAYEVAGLRVLKTAWDR